MEIDPSEKRSAPRIPKRLIVRVALYGQEPLKWSYCTVQNLSASGILFTYDRVVPLGALLYFKITFLDRVIECQGRVMRFKGDEQAGGIRDIGAQFENLSILDVKYIREYVELLQQRPQ